MASAQFIVSGSVQGVFFRASTQSRARELRLTGYARNRVDGCVEVVACGSPHALDELEAWLHVGPPSARVENVQRNVVEAQEFSAFVTR